MIRNKVTPTSKENWLALRAQNLNSSEISCLFGVNPYMTEFELWHRKKNLDLVDIEVNERMTWGSRLEPVIAQGIAEDNKWDIEPMKDYYRLPELRLGSSFDFCINDSAIMEIKNVDNLVYKNKWTEEEAPLHIELQIQHQMLVSGYIKTYLCALVGGNSVKIIPRDANEKVFAAIKKKAAQFWKSIDENIQPMPDFEKDSKFIISMNDFAEPTKIMKPTEVIDEMVSEYHRVSESIKLLEKEKEGLKAKILMEIKDCEKVVGDTYSISAGMIGPCKVEFERKGYRNFRLNIKKGDK